MAAKKKTPERAAKRTENVPLHVGDHMRKWRNAKGMSLEQVAEKIGCTKGHLSGAETGKGNLSLPLFLEFCKAIEAPASRVLEDPILQKQRDVDRLAGDIVKKAGLKNLRWLAELEKADLRLGLQRAKEAVLYAQSEREDADPVETQTG